MLRWFIADLRTGRQVLDVPVMDRSTWSRALNAAEQITAVLDMQDQSTIALHPMQTMAPGRTMIAVASDDQILAAGPIWAHEYSRDAKTLTLTGLGMWSYFDHRFLLPIVATTTDVTAFVIPDPSAEGKTKPNPALGTYLTDLEYGTIAKRWVQQSQTWTGGNVPVVFEADRSGAHERNHDGVDFKNIGTLLTQLTQIENGPDIRFKPRFTADRLGVEFLLQTGTDASPMLAGPTVHVWTVGVPGSAVAKFNAKRDATGLAGVAWATGGRTADTVLVSRSIDTTLTDLGIPLFETLDSSHSTVSLQGTLDGYTREASLAGRAPLDAWSFQVDTGQRPMLGEYWEGDWCYVTIPPYDQAEGVGDPYLFEGGTTRRRITGMSGDAKGVTVDLVTQAPPNG